MRSLHVAFDADDVVVDYVSLVCDVLNRDYGVTPPVTKDDIVSWEFGKFLDEHIGIDWWTWWETKAHLWGSKAKPIEGALGALEKLTRDGHRLEIVTSKPPWARRYMWEWCFRYDPLVSAVIQVPLNGDKTQYTNAQYLVDDRPKNVEEWVASRKDRQALLYFAPHNLDWKPSTVEHGRIQRVVDWAHVKHVLEGFANEEETA